MMLSLRRVLLPALILSLLFTACSDPEEVQIPENVLSKEKFTQLLFDMSLAEAAINVNVKNARHDKSDSVYAFNPLKENNVSREQYDTTIHFYSANPDLYKEVYDAVLERLSEFEARSMAGDTAKK